MDKKYSRFSPLARGVFGYLGRVKAVDPDWRVMVGAVEALDGEATVVVMAAGVVAAGTGHGLLWSLNHQLT